MKILVAGGPTLECEPGSDEEACAQAIARAVTSNGHALLSGGYNEFDRLVARPAGMGIPEPLRECDAIAVMGGGPGTHRVVHLGRFAGKPILPITAFDGAAKEAFDYEWDRFDEVYSGRVQRDEYSMLDSALPEDFDGLAHDVVLLATKIVTGSNVFVVMSFRRESDDTWGTIDRVCKLYRFDAERTDQDPTTDRIYQRIVEGIQRASFVIADVTFPETAR